MRISDWSSDVCSSDLVVVGWGWDRGPPLQLAVLEIQVLPPVDRRLTGHEDQHVARLLPAEPAVTQSGQAHALVRRHQWPGDLSDAVSAIATQLRRLPPLRPFPLTDPTRVG